MTLKNWSPNKAYKYFLDIFIDIYDNSFSKSEVKVKFKSYQSPWITKDIAKSSKKKQTSTLPTKIILNKTDIFDTKK